MIQENDKLLQFLMQLCAAHKAENVSRQLYAPGEIILDQKKRVFNAWVVKSGITKCYLTKDDGNDFIQKFFGKGEIFGELEVMNGGLSFCCIEAITDVEVFKIKASFFKDLLENDKKFNHLILEALSKKIEYNAIWHSYNQSHTIEDKLIRLKKEFPALMGQITKQDLANYLGITVRSLNRTISLMKKQE